MEKIIRIAKEKKEHFESPKAEIIVFGTEDVITASDGAGYEGNDGLTDNDGF